MLRSNRSRPGCNKLIKPGNVLLNGSGILITDFGLCLSLEDERLTGVNEAIGPRLYTAPENRSGFSEHLDQRPADFYSWGKLAWAVIAGQYPTDGEEVLLPEHRLEILLRDDCLAGLHALFERLLVRDPRSRLVDWGPVRRQLAEVLQEYDGRARPDAGQEQPSFTAAISTAHRIALKAGAAARIAEREQVAWRHKAARELQSLMFPEMHRLIGEDLGFFNEAAKREVEAALTSGGNSLTAMLYHIDFIPGSEADQHSLDDSSHAIMSLSWKSDPRREYADTFLFLSHYTLIEGDSVRLMRIPTIHRNGDPSRRFEGVEDLVHVSEPLPLSLAVTQNDVLRLIGQSTQIFRNLVIRWAQFIEAGLDPYTQEDWTLPAHTD